MVGGRWWFGLRARLELAEERLWADEARFPVISAQKHGPRHTLGSTWFHKVCGPKISAESRRLGTGIG